MRVHPAITEKDFWVCWILDYLFQESAWKDHLVFKGGTSLSKAFNAIERFSEDIDLVLDWRELGYSDDEVYGERSVTKQDRFTKLANQQAASKLETALAPQIREGLEARLGTSVDVIPDGANLLIRYPMAFPLNAIQPEVRLEIGPMAAWLPQSVQTIRPYAALHFPEMFQQSSTDVPTIDAERTFWEKATILHQEAHRAPDKPLPQRYARHYYDLYRLSLMPICDQALAQPQLLDDVRLFKMQFYRCPWASFETACPGSLQLMPSPHHRDALIADYGAMKSMLFGTVPTFQQIEDGIAELERRINGVEHTEP